MVAQPDMQVPTLAQMAFDDAYPEGPVQFTHDVHLDDRMTIARIADLADRLPPNLVVSDTSSLPLLAPEGSPAGALERPGDVIRDLNNANLWLTLLDIQYDPAYRELMNDLLDRLEPGVVAKDRKMLKRSAFVFVSSPQSVTPVHYDIEHNVSLQVSGSKIMHFGAYESEAARRHEFDRYWDGSLGRIETLPREIATYTLMPGQAVFIPPGMPHWAHVGPEASLSLTMTYLTPASVRENRIEDFNGVLRRLHLHPRPPGHSTTIDTAKVCGIGVLSMGRRLRSALRTEQRDGRAP